MTAALSESEAPLSSIAKLSLRFEDGESQRWSSEKKDAPGPRDAFPRKIVHRQQDVDGQVKVSNSVAVEGEEKSRYRRTREVTKGCKGQSEGTRWCGNAKQKVRCQIWESGIASEHGTACYAYYFFRRPSSERRKRPIKKVCLVQNGKLPAEEWADDRCL